MDKYFVCLANSYKRGGRCVAGVEIAYNQQKQWEIVRNENGNPHWIRPVADTQHGEIPIYIAYTIKLLSVVKLADVHPCPDHVHYENYRYSRMEICPLVYPSEMATLNQFVDSTHQSVFNSHGKAIPADVVSKLNYSLMLIHAENAQAYVDENREKSKNRMNFTYYGAEYDLPITDPTFLDEFRAQPERFAHIPNVFLTLSLGLEFEGWHHKLVAGVIIPSDSLLPHDIEQETSGKDLQTDWFDEYERELVLLIDKKAEIENRISEVRQKLLTQMEHHGVDKVSSKHFTVSYTPAKTVMQFDSKAFRTENKELYSSYCKPKQRDASIVVKRIVNDQSAKFEES